MNARADARTIIATMNRIDRATKKALREKERKERPTAKRSTAPVMAERYEKLFEQLTRTHCAPYARLDWNEIATRGLVEPAMRRNELELKARRKLANYQVGLIDALFGMGAERRRALTEAVLDAAKKDAELYAQAKRNAEVHNLDVNLAGAVMALDLNAIEQALKAHMPIDTLSKVLEGFAVVFPAPGRLLIYIDALEPDAMPDESVDIGESGRSVYRALPDALRQEMHLANVCAASLRVALEVMQVVPLEHCEVITRCFIPTPRGDVALVPVVYAKVPHIALCNMDMRRLEPVATITALGGRIDWDLSRGFSAVKINDLNLAGPAQPPRGQAPAPQPRPAQPIAPQAPVTAAQPPAAPAYAPAPRAAEPSPAPEAPILPPVPPTYRAA